MRSTLYYSALGLALFMSYIPYAFFDSNSDLSKSKENRDAESEILDKEYGVKYASRCEACKYLSIELQDRFEKLGQTSAVIETGYQIDGPKKRVEYTKSELYFIEALEGVCDNLLEYNIHKERTDSTRFAKGMSTTIKTLHQLVDKGVKVDLGIPLELWDSPSAEVTALKQQCEQYLEKYDDIIEQWYWGDRERPLKQYLCEDRILKKGEQECLHDAEPPKPEEYTPRHKTETIIPKADAEEANLHNDTSRDEL